MKREWSWDRLGSLVAGAIGGLWAGWAVLADDTPRWLTGMAGVFLLIGIGCAAALTITAWFVIIDDVRKNIQASSGFHRHFVRFWRQHDRG